MTGLRTVKKGHLIQCTSSGYGTTNCKVWYGYAVTVHQEVAHRPCGVAFALRLHSLHWGVHSNKGCGAWGAVVVDPTQAEGLVGCASCQVSRTLDVWG